METKQPERSDAIPVAWLLQVRDYFNNANPLEHLDVLKSYYGQTSRVVALINDLNRAAQQAFSDVKHLEARYRTVASPIATTMTDVIVVGSALKMGIIDNIPMSMEAPVTDTPEWRARWNDLTPSKVLGDLRGGRLSGEPAQKLLKDIMKAWSDEWGKKIKDMISHEIPNLTALDFLKAGMIRRAAKLQHNVDAMVKFLYDHLYLDDNLWNRWARDLVFKGLLTDEMWRGILHQATVLLAPLLWREEARNLQTTFLNMTRMYRDVRRTPSDTVAMQRFWGGNVGV